VTNPPSPGSLSVFAPGPTGKLIDAVSKGIGVLYEPTRIRRKATAESDARMIEAVADLEIDDLRRRALTRLVATESRREQNIESVIDRAAAFLPPHVSDAEVDPDWTARFFAGCQDVSSEELQVLWARLLAQEVAEPGTCSRRTLAVLQDMSPADAGLFAKGASLVCRIDDSYFVPMGLSATQALDEYGVSYGDLIELEALGLLHAKGAIETPFEDGDILEYCGVFFRISLPTPLSLAADVTVMPLTGAGVELYKALPVEVMNPWWVRTERVLKLQGISCTEFSPDAEDVPEDAPRQSEAAP
jgi:hypothetical protein